MHHDDLMSVIDIFYDSVGEGFEAEPALGGYSRLIGDTGILLANFSPDRGRFRNVWHVNTPTDSVSHFRTRFDGPADNIAFRHIPHLPKFEPIMVKSLMTESQYDRHPMIRELSRPWGIHDETMSSLQRGPREASFCVFLRHPEHDEFDQQTLSTIKVLNRHLAQSVSLQSRLDRLDAALIGSANALDLIDFGIVLFDSQNNPSFVNAYARRIFSAGDGLEIDSKGIRIYDRIAAAEFDRLFKPIYAQNISKAMVIGGVLRANRPSREKPYSLMIVPLEIRTLAGLCGASAAVFLFDPTAEKANAISLLATSYGFTPAETALAFGLVTGETLDGFASARGISRNTAKSQLHSMFAKTDTSRQAELVSLLLRSIAGVCLRNQLN